MIHVQIRQFEGPLALLLHLIRKEEMDIFDININEITKQYLEYIRLMRELDLEVASEFIAMAASLIHIKSRMLLPQYDQDGQIVQDEDPRKELVQRLVEYQRFQEVSRHLYERPLIQRELWTRGIRENFLSPEEVEEAVVVGENGLFSLVTAYRDVLRKVKKNIIRVLGEVQSIASRILEIKDRFVVGQRVRMHDLITAPDNSARSQLLVTFLSILELTKMGLVKIFQSQNYGHIYVDPQQTITSDVIREIPEYDRTENRIDLVSSEVSDETGELVAIDGEDVGQVATDEEINVAEQELVVPNVGEVLAVGEEIRELYGEG